MKKDFYAQYILSGISFFALVMRAVPHRLRAFVLGGALVASPRVSALRYARDLSGAWWQGRRARRMAAVFAGVLFISAAATQAVAAQTLYTCSMHPQIIRTEPGSCPICGMDLTPMVNNPAGGADALSVITVDTRTVQMMNLRTEVLVRDSAARDLRALGVVVFDESTRADITTRFGGWLEKLYVNRPWQTVKAGEPLFEIYSPALYGAQLNYLVALQSEGEGGGPLTAASLERLRLLGVPEAFIAGLAASGKAQRLYVYHAPQDGVVIEKLAVQGQKIEAGQAVYRLADISRVWVEAQIFEKDLPLVKAGQAVTLRAASAPGGAALDGVVDQVLPYVQEGTRTGIARIVVDNAQGALLPGMFADVSFTIPLGQALLLVPDEAILRSGAGNIVFVAQEDGGFSARPVELGTRTGDHRYIVNSGLNEGERVVVSGQFMLDSESRLREAIRKMTAAASASDTPASAASAAAAALAHGHAHGHAHDVGHGGSDSASAVQESRADQSSAHGDSHGGAKNTERAKGAAHVQKGDAHEHGAGVNGKSLRAIAPGAVVAAARGSHDACSHCNPAGSSASPASPASAVPPASSAVGAASVSQGAEAGGASAVLPNPLSSLALAAADSAAILAADDIVGYSESLPQLNAALVAYLQQGASVSPASSATIAPASASAESASTAKSAVTSAASVSPVLAAIGKAGGLPQRNTLALAREDFAPFSNALSAVVLGGGLGSECELHVMECPMVPKVGTGRWLQRSAETVANPFFGASMLRCGGLVR